jgi:hypothetical protein
MFLYLNKSNIEQTVMAFAYVQRYLTVYLHICVHLISPVYQYFLAAGC